MICSVPHAAGGGVARRFVFEPLVPPPSGSIRNFSAHTDIARDFVRPPTSLFHAASKRFSAKKSARFLPRKRMSRFFVLPCRCAERSGNGHDRFALPADILCNSGMKRRRAAPSRPPPCRRRAVMVSTIDRVDIGWVKTAGQKAEGEMAPHEMGHAALLHAYNTPDTFRCEFKSGRGQRVEAVDGVTGVDTIFRRPRHAARSHAICLLRKRRFHCFA